MRIAGFRKAKQEQEKETGSRKTEGLFGRECGSSGGFRGLGYSVSRATEHVCSSQFIVVSGRSCLDTTRIFAPLFLTNYKHTSDFFF